MGLINIMALTMIIGKNVYMIKWEKKSYSMY